MNKWPGHIEECIKASLEHGPDARFKCIKYPGELTVVDVFATPDLDWHHVPLKPPYIEQWGNEYESGFSRWHLNKDKAHVNRLPGCVAFHYRRIDPETGKTIHFETLEVFK